MESPPEQYQSDVDLVAKEFNSCANNLCEVYLLERGLSVEFARANGVEIDLAPRPERVIERLGNRCLPIWKLAKEILWFALRNERGERIGYMARLLPTAIQYPKYFAPEDTPPFITRLAYQGARNLQVPLIVTGGPLRALAVAQAGFASVGLGGFYSAHRLLSDGKLTLREDVLELQLKGRKVYICCDANIAANPELRHAAIRLFFLLASAGAEPYQLTTWDESRGKGIDDFLVNELREGGSRTAGAIVRTLITNARPFAETFSRAKIDLDAVECQLETLALGALYREQVCGQISRSLGVLANTLRGVGLQREANEKAFSFPEADPWPEAVSGHLLVEDMVDILRRHIILEDYGIFTIVLWCLLCWFSNSDKIDCLPFLTLPSPDKRCGKTRLQTVMEWFVPKPLSACNISAAVLYRTVEKYHPTLLVDEADTLAQENDTLRELLNAGHTRQKAFVLRCHPVTMEPERFSIWCPKSFALIGELPGTLLDRSIVVWMQRKKRGEKVEPLRVTTLEQRLEIRSKIARWYQDNQDRMEVLAPPTAEQLSDRDADNWLPLLQVAQLLGEERYSFALETMRKLNPSAAEQESQKNPAVALLVHLKEIYAQAMENNQEILLPIEGQGRDFLISSGELVARLNADKQAPWADWRKGQGLSEKKLGTMLSAYKVESQQKQVGNVRHRGYRISQLQPIFERYIPSVQKDPEHEKQG